LKPNFRIGWWRLGADFADSSKDDVSSKAKSLAHGAPYFLSVGTLEPRKSYPVALEAFERLWRAGKDVRYAIVGRRGWSARHIVKHILEHPEYEHRLFWFDDAGDADLDFLYKHARAVVAPSFAEGFGLPIVEAARHGLPTIASDIPVFREVGGDAIAYFDCLDSNSLADRIAEFLEAPKAPQDLPETSWRESTKLLLSLIRDEAYQLSLREPA
jgi:alpha-1,2-rhamnosyltransferase